MIQLPENVKFIIQTITEAGYEAFAVGGCIRDSILGREPEDWDITTSATPLQIKELFRRTIDTGIAHGTVTVMLDKEGFEVTTYRIDGEYEDSRHPKEVTFTASLKEDLRRRDFTINAMAYNDEVGLVDIFDGKKDIERKMIRCVGNPIERFTEDALRMMRAVRFSAQLDYEIEEQTKKAICKLAPNLVNISAERIQTELVKLVISPHPEKLLVAYETDITKVILPEFDACMKTRQKNPYHCYNVGEHTIKSMEAVRADKVLRLAMLFHDFGKPVKWTTDENGIDHFYGHPEISEEMTRQILRRLKFDNETLRIVTALVKFHDMDINPAAKSIRRSILKTGEDIFPLLLEVKRADMEAQSSFSYEKKLELLQAINKAYEEVLEAEQCVSLKTLAVTGRDLMQKLNMPPGKEIGEILKQLLDYVIEEPAHNQKELLLEKAMEYRTTE